ncbi:valacyclovir hydrolase isoform X2 [Paramormyrops kingsleyae]|uniref:valacyclovir hydrolase isoform X2 n=1 Tax=Paramormyrops kingsleyae TaxID=1676925 RepID=UPI000CD66205|nr:valacyclovir hydrolase isoform X2 [Paramormyrops kingsleyae]
MAASLGLCCRRGARCTFLTHRKDVGKTLQRALSLRMDSGKQKVNGSELFYRRTGRGDHVVLLLPGALGSGQTDFGPQLKDLSKERFTLVSYDPRGYGRSRPPDRDFPPDFFDRDAKDAVDLMQTLGFGKFSLLGWSDGGITALIAAARNRSSVKKLVIWGANAYVSDQDVKIYNAIKDVSTWSSKMRKPMEDMYGPEYFTRTWEAWVEAMSDFAQRPNGTVNVITSGSICRDVLPRIGCPTLIVHGEKDSMVPSFHPQYLLQNIQGSCLHLMPEGKHNLHLRFAAEFNRLVDEFLCQ